MTYSKLVKRVYSHLLDGACAVAYHLSPVLCVAFLFYFFWMPGIIGIDLVNIIKPFIFKNYDTWFSPFIAVVWGWLIYVGPGVRGVFLLHLLLLSISLSLIFYAMKMSMWKRVLYSAFFFCLPLVFFTTALITRDVTFSSFLLLSLGLLYVNNSQRKSILLEIFAFFMLIAAVSSRQEGIVLAAFIVVWHIYVNFQNVTGSLQRKFVSLFIRASVLPLFLLIQSHILYPSMGVAKRSPENYFYLIDLIYVSRNIDTCLMCDLKRERCSDEQVMKAVHTPSKKWFDWLRGVASCLHFPGNSRTKVLWYEMIKEYPNEFLDMRLGRLTRTLSRPVDILWRFLRKSSDNANGVYGHNALANLPDDFEEESAYIVSQKKRLFFDWVWSSLKGPLLSALPYFVLNQFVLFFTWMLRHRNRELASLGILLSVLGTIHLVILLLVGAGGLSRFLSWFAISSGLSLIVFVELMMFRTVKN